MNRNLYQLVWNRRVQAWVPAAETAIANSKGKGQRTPKTATAELIGHRFRHAVGTSTLAVLSTLGTTVPTPAFADYSVNGTTADGTGCFGNMAIGASDIIAQVTACDGIAIGSGASAMSPGSTVTGSAYANPLAVGSGSQALGRSATALGSRSTASGDAATAVGGGSGIDTGGRGINIGGATAQGFGATALATGSFANGDDATAAGQLATASGTTASAFGQAANATGSNVTALGQGATANQDNTLAVGSAATASIANSVALGAHSVATTAAVPVTGDTIAGTAYTYAGGAPAGVVSVGSTGNERQITNVAAGQVLGTSTDAVNGSQLYATNAA
ncbi:ESPR-type extended signal peptide-containing protein, partial [Paraburkholderia humisilvae]